MPFAVSPTPFGREEKSAPSEQAGEPVSQGRFDPRTGRIGVRFAGCADLVIEKGSCTTAALSIHGCQKKLCLPDPYGHVVAPHVVLVPRSGDTVHPWMGDVKS